MSADASLSNAVVVSDLSLVERISKIEESLKELKRAARHELKNRRRRRGLRAPAGEKGVKGETPAQLVAWHNEVRKVWDEMRKADAKTPYKRAVAEASARRKGGNPVVASSSVPVVSKSKKAAAPSVLSVPVVEVKVASPVKKAVKAVKA